VSLVEMQSCLARLYVSADYREQFRRDPDAALARYVLAPDEQAAVRDLDQKMLEFFAGTLISKRLRRVQRAYAASFGYDSATMHTLFHRCYEMHGARPQPTVHHDTAAFGRFAEDSLSDPERFHPAAAELVRYERMSYEASFLVPAPRTDAAEARPLGSDDRPEPAPDVSVSDFDYDVVALDAALREEGSGVVPEQAPGTIVFRPVGSAQEQRMLRLNGASALVLRCCDGRPVRDTVAEVERSLGATGLDGAIVETLQRLVYIGVLTVPAGSEVSRT
jgi:hypothetical protein